MSAQVLLPRALFFVVLPLWLAAAAADYLCHRWSLIERTSGVTESRLHALLYAEIALPVLAGLYLDLTASVVSFMALAVAAHMATSLWDTSYSQPRRYISPLEQHVHSYLEMLPLFALGVVVILAWDALHAPDWELRWRSPPLPALYRNVTLLVLFLGALPIFEEWLRTSRQRTRD